MRTILLVVLTVFVMACGNEASQGTATGGDAAIGVAPDIGPFGLSVMEMRIIRNSNIVKARMTAVEANVVSASSSKFYPGLKFNLNVVENLKGTSTANVVAFWVFGHTPYDTNAEAMTAANTLLAARDTQWDAREAIIFLNKPTDEQRYVEIPASLLSPTNHYLLAWTSSSTDDRYSLYSSSDRLWLPAVSNAPSGDSTRSPNDDQRFLTALPSGSSGRSSRAARSPNADTVTLGDAKSLIRTTMAEYNGGDGSTAYKKCVFDKYNDIPLQRKFEARGRQWTSWPTSHAMDSGLPARALIHEYSTIFTDLQNGAEGTVAYTITGDHASLFMGESGPRDSYDDNNDGTRDRIGVTEYVRTTRPLPAGKYEFGLKELWPIYAICGRTMDTKWDVTVTPPARSLHEAFFDPVTDGSAVAADSSNGKLEPASFTDANDASATVQRIEWASDTVKMKVSPHTGLAGHKLDFIELDGTVSLSLDVDDATVDAANKTLSWTVTPQPWENSDKLMLRITKVPLGIAVTEVPSTITHGSSESLTVKASGLTSSNSYSIRLSTNNSAIRFGDTCSTITKTVTVPSGNTTHSTTIALQGCLVVTSSTITATLLEGTSTVATATAEVEVEASSSVTVTLSRREAQPLDRTNITVEWVDADGCDSRYFVGIYTSGSTFLY